jgi:hypothetical protein
MGQSVPKRRHIKFRRRGITWLRLFSSQTFSRINTPTFSTPVILHTYPHMKMEQSVPKRWHIKFRRRGITQKKAYNNLSPFSKYESVTLVTYTEGAFVCSSPDLRTRSSNRKGAPTFWWHPTKQLSCKRDWFYKILTNKSDTFNKHT